LHLASGLAITGEMLEPRPRKDPTCRCRSCKPKELSDLS
jgi:hypothetical protein